MWNGGKGARGRRLAGMGLMVAAAAALSHPVQAAAAQPATQLAQAEDVRAFNVPPQKLGTALDRFADQAGLAFAYKSEDVAGLQSPGVVGTFSVNDGLQRLLAGSGLHWNFTNPHNVILEKATADGAMMLAPVNVEGATPAQAFDGPMGPDVTVVAKRSATGSKTDTDILELPAAVSVVTQKELERRNVHDLQQALSYTSGVVVDGYGSDDRYDYFAIRGFQQTTLGNYRDGLSMRIPGWTTSRLEPYGLQRVEVLKGSTSTLFGLNGPGGLVNSITKRPQSDPHGEAYTTFGEDHVEAGTDFGGPLDEQGIWSYRLTAMGQDGDHDGDYSNDDRIYVAPALTAKSPDGTSLTLLTDYSKRKGNAGYGYPAGADVGADTFLGEPDFNKFDTEQIDVGYLLEHPVTDRLAFRQNARYTHLTLDYEQVYALSADPTADRAAFAVDGTVNRFAIDNQLQYDRGWGAVETKTLVGVDFSYDKNHEIALYGSAPGVDLSNPVYCGRGCITLGPYVNWTPVQKALGVYVQEQLTLDRRWILTLGGRYDHVKTEVDYPDLATRDESTDVAFTKRVGLTYKATEAVALYANYSESFQPLVAPTFNGYAVQGALEPQEGRQYEVGVKYRPQGVEALFTLALFDLTQTNVPVNVSPSVQSQIGEVEVRGIELEGKMALDDRMNLTVAYAYWDAEVTKDGIAGNVGKRPGQTPEHMASAWLDYTIPGEGARGDLTSGIGVRFVGSSYGDPGNTTKVDSYTVFDAGVDYKITDHVSAAVNATNLFDKKYVSTDYYGTVYYGDRRKVLATLKYNW
ncbi:TonB-dependent siderophore receptor [Azospirillum sp. ST 5-10]|uniref:TonB-dependent siderophore receptor n=1 Tax=unclassified Azospirillum TaxID=2630922 RepID=UPI003F49E0FF